MILPLISKITLFILSHLPIWYKVLTTNDLLYTFLKWNFMHTVDEIWLCNIKFYSSDLKVTVCLASVTKIYTQAETELETAREKNIDTDKQTIYTKAMNWIFFMQAVCLSLYYHSDDRPSKYCWPESHLKYLSSDWAWTWWKMFDSPK